MEIAVNTTQLPAPGLPPCLMTASSAQAADSGLKDKETAPEGEFAALLASLRKPSADKAAGETCTGIAEQLVPAGWQLVIQPAVTADIGSEAENVPVYLPVRWSGSGNAPAGTCLPGSPPAGLLSALPGVEGKSAVIPDAPESVEPGPAKQHAQDEAIKTVPLPEEVTPAGVHPPPGTPAVTPDAPESAEPGPATQHAQNETIKTVPLPEEVTPTRTEHDGPKGVFEQQLQSGGREGATPGAAKMTPTGAHPSPGTPAEGKPGSGSEQEKNEARLAESSTQSAVRPILTPAEPAQAEAVRRLQAVKSAVLEQVLERMVFLRSESGEAKVFIRLKPPTLGEVEISLYLEDGRLTGRIVAENAMVRELLDASLAQLRQRLEAQQLQVAELTVSIGQEKEFHRGRDSREDGTQRPGGREKTIESASPVPDVLPGLLNALA